MMRMLLSPGDVFPPKKWRAPGGDQFSVSPEVGHALLESLEAKTEHLERGTLQGHSLRSRIEVGKWLYEALAVDPPQSFRYRLNQWHKRLTALEHKMVSGEPQFPIPNISEAEDFWRIVLPKADPLAFAQVCVDRGPIPWAECAHCQGEMEIEALGPLSLRCACGIDKGVPMLAPWHSNGRGHTLFLHPYGTAPRAADQTLLAEYLARHG